VSDSLIMPPKRTTQMIGNKAEADRMRGPFMRWVGNRTYRQALADAGIPCAHGTAWLSSGKNLADKHQITARRILDQAGITVSPCG